MQFIPISALNKKAEGLLWHKRMLHCGTHSFKNIHKHVDGVPNLNDFSFDDLCECPSCLKTNLSKVPPGHSSLRDRVTQPYQGLYMDFSFAGKVQKDAN